jgi:hypothetical protein
MLIDTNCAIPTQLIHHSSRSPGCSKVQRVTIPLPRHRASVDVCYIIPTKLFPSLYSTQKLPAPFWIHRIWCCPTLIPCHFSLHSSPHPKARVSTIPQTDSLVFPHISFSFPAPENLAMRKPYKAPNGFFNVLAPICPEPHAARVESP